jgi:DNA-binding GntR family transcriptional regulator
VERQALKRDIAYGWLRRQILSGELEPGQRLVLQRLADRLSMSKMPVREACLRLQQEGLVEFASHKGAVVSGLSRQDMIDMTRVIMWNETLAVVESVPMLDALTLDEAAAALGEERQAIDVDDAEAFVQATRRFHHQIAANAHSMTRDLINDLRTAASRGRRPDPTPLMMASVHADHERILTAVRGGDRAEVFREMEAHRANQERDWTGVAGDGSTAPPRHRIPPEG